VAHNPPQFGGCSERIASMHKTSLLAFLLFLAAAPGTAEAAATTSKSTSRSAMEKAAKKACITGEVREGINLLGDLFVETNDTTYIYNQGRCFEQNHRWEDAIDRFREYLRKNPDLTKKDKDEINGHISDCEAQQAKSAPPPAAAVTAPPSAPFSTATLPAAPAAATENLVATPVPVAAEQHSTSRLRTAGIVTAGVGVLALAGGLICNLHANSLANELSGSTYDRSKASSRDTYVTLGWVGYGLGAAALVAGSILFVLGGHSEPAGGAPAAVSLSPVLLPGYASLTLHGVY
jgi:TolA-binding protein